MTEIADERPLPLADDREEAARERRQLVYVGHSLPWPVIAIWAAFLLFGLCYFLAQL